MKTVIIATTLDGTARVSRLAGAMPEAELVLPARFRATPQRDLAGLHKSITAYQRGELSEVIAARFRAGNALICCLSVGAVVRLIAPHLTDKASDPAVVAFDEQARFVVPVVGGHLGGANSLAEQVATAIGAQAVITTASDSSGLPAIDLLGIEQGWQVEAQRQVLRRAAAAMVDGEPIALIEQAATWQPRQPVPDNLTRVRSWQEIEPQDYAALLWVTDAPTSVDPQIGARLVIYRPTCLPGASNNPKHSSDTDAPFLNSPPRPIE